MLFYIIEEATTTTTKTIIDFHKEPWTIAILFCINTISMRQKNIKKVIKSLENRGILLKETAKKIVVKKEDPSILLDH